MKRTGILCVTALALFGLEGCLYMTAAQSTAGRTYVIRNELVGSSYWNCYANNGDPICYQVTKLDKNAPMAALDSQPQGGARKVATAAVEEPKPVEAKTVEPAATEKKKPAAKPKQASNTPSTRKPLIGDNP
ncbi:MAG: hypothetical protein IT381_16920 [Deltaproteobacteria bacterium]|nr:hypothetical protein [Deltaproteobacteria bacterium]